MHFKTSCIKVGICTRFIAKNLSCRENQTFFLRINSDHADTDLFVEPLVQIVYMIQRQTGCRNESANTIYISDHAGIYNTANFYIQNFFVIHVLLQGCPYRIQ